MWPLFTPQVFNLNAPVPPANETEALNQASQYQNSYNQAFSSQSQHPVEQAEMQSEQLQSGGQILKIDCHYLLTWVDCAMYVFQLWKTYIFDFVWRLTCNRFVLFSSWCLPFPRPVRRPPAAFAAGPRLRQAGSVLLQQQRHVSWWTSQCQGHDQWLQRLIEWIQG